MSNHGRTLLRIAGPTLTCALAAALTTGLTGPTASASAAHGAGGASVGAVAAAARTPGADIRVASFNVQSVSLDRTSGARRPWKVRRATVIRQILQERVDVIGLQELNPSNVFRSRLVAGTNMMLDLRNGLNRSGGRYRLNSNAAVNCARAASSYRCRFAYRAASGSERILYNTRTLTQLRRGFVRYSRQGVGAKMNGMVWSVLRSRVNGKRFLFTSTHLDARSRSTRVAQWQQMIAAIKRLRGNMPVVSVGDFNAHKFDPITRTMLPAMKRAGVGDVLNQQYRVNPSRGVRAERRVHAWVNSYNHSSRNVAGYGYPHARSKTGVSIDYIFASNRLRVKEFKVVLNFDPRTLRVRGVLPSDHNMLRATVVLR
ncbi:MAG TPA: endonuclease/exonuclease/phosphatase family protein [Nocardioidaceae bacterium]|nr:endonuclease/exonuclease/phosphatase family protein [Nocardioidaceae bacterium]